MLVVGNDSTEGQIRASLGEVENSMTPLQEKLDIVAKDIGRFGLISAITIVFILIARYSIEKSIDHVHTWTGWVDVGNMLKYVLLGVQFSFI